MKIATQTIIPMTKTELSDQDFVKDGLIHCGACGKPKQYRLLLPGKERIVTCMCQCEADRRRRLQQEREAQERMESIRKLRTSAIQFQGYRDCTFAADDGKNPVQMDLAKRYVKKWQQMYRENIGLLLWGDVGTGKTFFAACIANALTDQMEPTLMTNFTQISELMGFDGTNQYLAELKKYKLLALDDLGAERQSDYMMERVFGIIDARYKDKQPVIITTNLTLQEIKHPTDLRYKRIYDRMLEMCVPIKFGGQSRRKEKHEEKKAEIKALFAE